MAKSKFFLTQHQIKSILDAYSCRPGEFVEFGENKDRKRMDYRSSVLKGFVLAIEPGNWGDIHVLLTSLGGRRTVTDVWKLTSEEVPEFLYRCNSKTIMDSVVLDEYKNRIRELELEYRKKLKEIEKAYHSRLVLKDSNNVSENISDTVDVTKRGRPQLDESIKAGIRESLSAGMSIRKVAAQYHVSTSTVQKYK